MLDPERAPVTAPVVRPAVADVSTTLPIMLHPNEGLMSDGSDLAWLVLRKGKRVPMNIGRYTPLVDAFAFASTKEAYLARALYERAGVVMFRRNIQDRFGDVHEEKNGGFHVLVHRTRAVLEQEYKTALFTTRHFPQYPMVAIPHVILDRLRPYQQLLIPYPGLSSWLADCTHRLGVDVSQLFCFEIQPFRSTQFMEPRLNKGEMRLLATFLMNPLELAENRVLEHNLLGKSREHARKQIGGLREALAIFTPRLTIENKGYSHRRLVVRG